MNPQIVLCCLVVVIGSLVGSTCAQQNFESDRERVIEVYKNATPESVGDSNIVFLVNFLEKYHNQIQLTTEQRSKVADAVRQYNEEKAKQPLVDGAPPQGGWFTKLLRTIIVQIGIELASEGVKKATGSED